MKSYYRNDIDLRRFLRSVRSLWWLYAASAIFFIAAAIYYCATRPAAYESHALIMIEDRSSGNAAAGSMNAMMRTFSVGGFAGSSVDNEILLVGSHDVLISTIKRLGLNRNYTLTSGGKRKGLFNDSPVMLDAPELFFDTLSVPFSVELRISGKKADVKVTKGRWLKTELAEAKGVTLPYVLSTPMGSLTLMPTAAMTPGYEGTIRIDVSGNEATQSQLYNNVQIDVTNKMADAISLEITDEIPERGRAILNTIIEEYNSKRIGIRQNTAKEDIRFYDDRINELFTQLKESEQNIERYQTDNKLAGVYVEADALVKNSVATKGDIARLQSQIVYYEQVLDALHHDTGDTLLPYVVGWSTPQIEEYNRAVMNRKNLSRSAKENNPALLQSNELISDLKTSIINNIGEVLANAKSNLQTMYGITGAAASRLNTLPHHEREFITLNRDKTMKNELYLFLMQKRETAALEASSTAALGFIVDEAYTDVRPSRKKYILVICASLLLALLIPTSVAVARTILNDRVYGPIDMAAAGTEKRTVVCGEDQTGINRLRTLIMEHPSVRRIYVAAVGDAEFPTEALAVSMRNAGLKVSVNTGETDNDALLHTDPGPDHSGYSIISIPDADRIGELRPVLSDPDSMLAVAIRCGAVTRRHMKRLTEEVGNACLAIVIVKSGR